MQSRQRETIKLISEKSDTFFNIARIPDVMNSILLHYWNWLIIVYICVMDRKWPCTGRLVLNKNCFSAWASALNMGLINKGWYGMFVACGIWCLADVSSVSPSSEQTEGLWRKWLCTAGSTMQRLSWPLIGWLYFFSMGEVRWSSLWKWQKNTVGNGGEMGVNE